LGVCARGRRRGERRGDPRKGRGTGAPTGRGGSRFGTVWLGSGLGKSWFGRSVFGRTGLGRNNRVMRQDRQRRGQVGHRQWFRQQGLNRGDRWINRRQWVEFRQQGSSRGV
jgi:hypothetical protein